jgi:hypothetical protein
VRHTGENENKKTEKDTDVVRTWADPIRGEYKEAVYRVRRMIRVHCSSQTGLTAGTDRTNPGEHILGHGIFTNMANAKWSSGLGASGTESVVTGRL